jgi:hypothetical protein
MADAVQARGHFCDHLRRYHAGMHGDHEFNALCHHGQRGSEDPGGEIGTEKALGDQSCVEPKLVSAADHVVCELKGSICAARDTGARFDLRDGAIHSRFGPNGVRQRSPDSEFHRASGYD